MRTARRPRDTSDECLLSRRNPFQQTPIIAGRQLVSKAGQRQARPLSPLKIPAVTRFRPSVIVAAAGALRLAAGLWLGFRPFDDTYITFRYARNLASGAGFVYNIGQPV